MAAEAASELRHLAGVTLQLPVALTDTTRYQWLDPTTDARLMNVTRMPSEGVELDVLANERRAQLLRTLPTATADQVGSLAGTRFTNLCWVAEAKVPDSAVLHVGALDTGPDIVLIEYVAAKRDERAFAHALRSLNFETGLRTAAPGFTPARYGRYLFEVPSDLVSPSRFGFEGPSLRVTIDRERLISPTLADFAEALGATVAEMLTVVDDPVRDVQSEAWTVVQRQYRVHHGSAAPEHTFRLVHLNHGGQFVLSLLIHAAPGFVDLEALTRSAVQSVRLEKAP